MVCGGMESSRVPWWITAPIGLGVTVVTSFLQDLPPLARAICLTSGFALLLWGGLAFWWHRSRSNKVETISYDELGDLLIEKNLLLPGDKERGLTMLALRLPMERGEIAPLDRRLPSAEWRFDRAEVERWLGPGRALPAGRYFADVAFSEGVEIENNEAVGFDGGLRLTHSRDTAFRHNRIAAREKDGGAPHGE